MKKIIITILMLLTIIAIQKNPEAQGVGVGDIIFDGNAGSAVKHEFITNEISYNIINLQLSIAGKNMQTVNYEWDILTNIKRLEELTKTDVIALLDVSPNKQEALTKYLNDCNQELQKWGAISAYMTQELNILKWDMQSCNDEKAISDKAYFDAIERYDQKIMESSLKDSISFEICSAENRIQYNAKTGIARKLVFYLWVLQKKYDLLFAKQEIVAKNFEIFRDNILPDLNQIDALLQQYKF